MRKCERAMPMPKLPLSLSIYEEATSFFTSATIIAMSKGIALIGGTIIGFLGNWSDRIRPLIWSMFIMGITMGMSGFLPQNYTGFLWFFALNAISGIATPFFNTLLMAMIQQSYPPEQLGRVLGIMNSLMSLAGPVGLIFAGPLADKIGVNNLFVIAGLGTIVCGIFVFMNATTRNYDKELQKEID